jgi:hypothetical protein
MTKSGARVVLSTDRDTFFLGENVLVHYCLRNDGASPITIEVGGDYRGASRSLRFKVQVKDAAGGVQPDPDPNPVCFGGLGYSPKIEPGKAWCQSLQLARYARIDAPGEYTVQVTHDLGWPEGTAPTGSTTVKLAMPTASEAERVVTAMDALPRDPSTSAGEKSIPFADFTALRYAAYLAPLESRAQAGSTDAVAGIGSIPTPDATRALIALLGRPTVARTAMGALAYRLPDPALDGTMQKRNPFDDERTDPRKYFVSTSWRPELASSVLAATRPLLGSRDVQDVVAGAFVLEALGSPGDGGLLEAALTAAIDRTRTEPRETDVFPTPRGACMELMRAAKVLERRGLAPAATPSTSGQWALWLTALDRGARPAGWESLLGKALVHPLSYVRQIALERTPPPVPHALVPAVRGALEHGEVDELYAACDLARRAGLTELRPQILAVLSRSRDTQLTSVASYAAFTLGDRQGRVDALVGRLADPATLPDALRDLVDLLEHSGSSSQGQVTAEQARAVAARWRAFVKVHRADIAANRRIPLTDPSVTPDLLPPGWKLGRPGTSDWP